MMCLSVLIFFATIYLCACCPNGWVTHGAKCYHFSSETETWPDAMALCQIMKGQLVEIEDSDENNYLVTQAKQHRLDYWIALSDLEEEGSWVWMNSGQHLTAESFTDWAPSRPDNYGGNENCGVLFARVAFHWNDAPCKLAYHYICEADDSVHLVG